MEGVSGIFRLNAGLFDTSAAAYYIWQNLMIFANIGMTIILIVIIFSQLTGYGIDNYGIKKMLPKLIVTAILINLSFLICQIAVDLSNIIGRGFVDLSKGIYSDVLSSMNITAGDWIERGFGFLFTTIFAAGAGAAAASGVIITAISLGPLWFIPLIFVVLIGLISFIIFFLLLATRQLLAVILVVVSPLAMLCYILPNTQGIFKKWTTLFKAILIIYPVCGALYGISKLMKLVAYSADGVHILMVMVAMLMTFLPFYAAPLLIKKALAGFDMIGGMISGMGEKMKGGIRQADSFMRGSAMYQDAQRTASINRAQRNVDAYQAVRSGNATRRQRLRSFMSGGERGFARNSAFVERNQAEDVETSRMAMRDETGNYNVDIMGNQLESLLNVADTRELTRAERNRVGALASELSNQQGGAKMLSSTMAGRTGRSAQVMGEYMAQNAKVRSAVSDKSQRTSSRLSDIAAGAIDANTTQAQYDAMNNAYLKYRRATQAEAQTRGENANFMSEADWIAQERAAGRTVDNTTVVENIAQNVLDRDKMFVSQSGTEVRELLKHIDQARIDRMAANPNLFSYGDIAEGTEMAVRAAASSSKSSSGGGSTS